MFAWWTAAALAAGPDVAVSASTTLVSGPVNAGTDNASGEEAAGRTWNPALQFGLASTLVQPLSEHVRLAARWGVRRDQRVCDTCTDADGLRPGNGGGLQAIDSEDLSLTLSHGHVASSGPVTWTSSLLAVVPASRDAFVCNPFYGALGATAGGNTELGAARVGLNASARRDLYRFAAAPVGLTACSRGLVGTPTQAATGAVSPQPWDGTRFAGTNPAWSTAMRASLANPHGWIGGPDWLTTHLSGGVGAVQRRSDGETVVQTLTGSLSIAPAANPWLARVPLSAGIGVTTERVDLWLTANNSLPGLMTDSRATLSALPATTATTLSATGRW